MSIRISPMIETAPRDDHREAFFIAATIAAVLVAVTAALLAGL